MKRLLKFYWLTGCIVLAACTQNQTVADTEAVVYHPTDLELLQAPFIKEITWTPLETKEGVLLGQRVELVMSNQEYFIVDKNGTGKVFRFNSAGDFLNTIGIMGQGPGEYLRINDVLIPEGGTVEIFSSPNVSRYVYTKDGAFVSQKEYDYLADRVAKEGDAYWVYIGYGGIRPERIVKIDTTGKELAYDLFSDAKVLHMGGDFPVFSGNEGRLFLRESLNPSVYELSKNKARPLYRFDFGEWNVPENYFEYGDAFKAAEELMKKPFASIEGFAENSKYTVVMAMVDGEKQLHSILGIKEKLENKWYWFDCFQEGKNAPFCHLLITLTDTSELICLVPPDKIVGYNVMETCASNRTEIMSKVKEDDNYLVLRMQLK